MPTILPTTFWKRMRSIKEGEVVGLPGEVQVTAHEATTFLDGDEAVLAFEFE